MTIEQEMEPGIDLKNTSILVYALYLANIALPLVGIIGVIIAYMKRGDAPAGPRSHFTYQIYTFWLGLLYSIITGLLCFVIIGFLLIPVLFIWYVARVVVGLIRATENRPIENPTSWILW